MLFKIKSQVVVVQLSLKHVNENCSML